MNHDHLSVETVHFTWIFVLKLAYVNFQYSHSCRKMRLIIFFHMETFIDFLIGSTYIRNLIRAKK
jgi:hypothetical protein